MGIRCRLGLHYWKYSVETPVTDWLDIFLTGDEPMRRCDKCYKHEWLLTHCLGLNPFTLAKDWVMADNQYVRNRTTKKPVFDMEERDFEVYMLLINHHFLTKTAESRPLVSAVEMTKIHSVEKKLYDMGIDPVRDKLIFNRSAWDAYKERENDSTS